MNNAYVREIYSPSLHQPIFIQGLPGFGNIGRITAHLLIKHSGAKPFAELYSPNFPDYVSVSTKGICQLPRYEFYNANIDNEQVIIMSGETQPSFEDILSHYNICNEVLDYIKRLGCKFIVTIGGVPLGEEKAQIYVAATSKRLSSEFSQKGAERYSRGKIVGGTGLLLGLAKEKGLEGVCLLGATTGFKDDEDKALSVFNFLMKALGKEINGGVSEKH